MISLFESTFILQFILILSKLVVNLFYLVLLLVFCVHACFFLFINPNSLNFELKKLNHESIYYIMTLLTITFTVDIQLVS